MRRTAAVALLALLTTLPATVAQARPEPGVHYYVDSGCSDCTPDDELERGDYWLITAAVHAAPRDGLEEVAESYRTAVRRRFDHPESLTGNVVVRFRDTVEDARGGRRDKIDKMRERGYRIIEIRLESEDGAASVSGTGTAPARW